MIEITHDNVIDVLDSAEISRRTEARLFLKENQEQCYSLLLDALISDTKRACWEAARILTATRDPRWLQPMTTVLGTDNILLGQIAVRSIQDYHPNAVDILCAALPSAGLHTQPQIIQALGELNASQSVAALVELLQATESPTVRYTVIHALQKLNAVSTAPIIQAYLGDENHHVREYAVQALKHLQQYSNSSV